jgi:spermidine/putrescine transport system substrate-binding protein
VRFAFPESGATSWADTMIMPKGAVNRDAAAQWMNFVYDPEQAAQITAWVGYVSPVEGVREALDGDRSRAGREPAGVPRRRDVAMTQSFASLSDDVEAEYDAAFSRIIGA